MTKASEAMDIVITRLVKEVPDHDSVSVDGQLTSISVQHCDDCK